MHDNDGRIRRDLIFLVVITVIVLLLAVALSTFTYAQNNLDLHQRTLNEITTHAPSENSHIAVGKGPRVIAVNENTNTVYVANSDDGTISVIDATNNKKITDIKVRKNPHAIALDGSTVYVANEGNNTVSVIDATNNKKITDIKVGKNPVAIGVDFYRNRAYVANKGNNTVSVIDATNNKKIEPDIKVRKNPHAIALDGSTVYVANKGNNTVSVIGGITNEMKGPDIKVGKNPVAIGVAHNKVYVANIGNDTVSVIDATNNKKIEPDIKVGIGPIDIAVDKSTVYVANEGNNTVSVIDATNNKKIEPDIKVGKNPHAIAFDGSRSTVYVANIGDNTVSVIDDIANKVVAKVMFNIEPFNAGHIECVQDKENKSKPPIAPIAQEFYVWDSSQCVAKPNQGFEFVSWQENLGGNSTQFLNFSSSASFLNSISDSFLDLFGIKPDKPESKLTVTKFGNFTANFRALPPPIPKEYVATLITVVATAFIGTWLTPTIIGWRKARKQGSKLDYYHNEVKKLCRDNYNGDNDGELYRSDIEKLNDLKDDITGEYTRSKINKEQYDELGDEISINYGEIFTKEINSLNSLSEDDHKEKRLSAVKSDIEEIRAKGRINNEYYVNLKNEISTRYKEIYNKKIGNKIGLDEIKNNIANAYAEGKINEQHYKLLNEKISDSKNNQQNNNNQLAPSSQNLMSTSTNQGSPIKR